MDAGIDIDSVLATDRWVTEGIYLWDVERVLSAAVAVVWLDLPHRTAVRRIVVRHFWLSARRRNRHRGLRLLWSFARTSGRYWTDDPRPPEGPTDYGALSRSRTIETLLPYWDKVVVLTSRREVAGWLRGLAAAR
ncbi:MAG TPA: hypothetical protein VE990_05970 [Acidimicrobiales bacterium]|nr:hypothetical protein [Acidimicrobiales bacterium]